MVTSDSVAAEKQVTSCVTCTLLHVLRDEVHYVAKCQNKKTFAFLGKYVWRRQTTCRFWLSVA